MSSDLDQTGLRHEEPYYKHELVEKAMAAQEPVSEVEWSDDERTLRVFAIQEVDGTAWFASIEDYLPGDGSPSVDFKSCYPHSEHRTFRKWTSLATGRLTGPQKLPDWESIFTVFNVALSAYTREVNR